MFLRTFIGEGRYWTNEVSNWGKPTLFGENRAAQVNGIIFLPVSEKSVSLSLVFGEPENKV